MDSVTIIIETPKGSAQKYDYEESLLCFKLNKILPAGMVFPFDFGFIPGTKGEDGDPLDIIVISEIKTFPGCAMDCRIIGAIKAQQTEKYGKSVRNDRFIGIPLVSTMFGNVNAIDKLPKKIFDQVEDFFINYNKEAGKKFKVLAKVPALKAYKSVIKQKK
jgi:inorganic pyrophosphatase